ncbi:MAG: hypothetical protein HY811_04680 [Planctomycetes bacterium]|nr:hypothetical protein [Planctomycetota bacterium]
MTNYPEFHSHRWARNLKEAGERAHNKTNLDLLYKGDFANPRKIFPGLKVMAAFWKSEEEMMRCRFDVMAEYAKMPELTQGKDFSENLKISFDKFIQDVKELVKRNKILPEKSLEEAIKANPPKTPDNWADILKQLFKDTEKAVAEGNMPEELLNRWLIFCLQGIIAYNYGLIKQAVLCGLILKKHGEKKMDEIIEKSRDDYGWRLSRIFFREVFPAADITDMTDLQTLGRYGMFADQEVITEEKMPPADKKDTEPKVKTSQFLNCQEYSIFDTVFKLMKVPVNHAGVGMCAYCEEHGRKNTQLFVPPSMHPETKLLQALALGADKCIFETKLYPANDMERFMEAQNKVFGEE